MKHLLSNKRLIILICLFLAVALFAIVLVAQQSGSAQTAMDPIPAPNIQSPFNGTELGSAFTITIDILISFAGLFAFIAIVYSGISYIVSAGEPEATEKAKKNLIWAIIGCVIVTASFAILRYISTDLL